MRAFPAERLRLAGRRLQTDREAVAFREARSVAHRDPVRLPAVRIGHGELDVAGERRRPRGSHDCIIADGPASVHRRRVGQRRRVDGVDGLVEYGVMQLHDALPLGAGEGQLERSGRRHSGLAGCGAWRLKVQIGF